MSLHYAIRPIAFAVQPGSADLIDDMTTLVRITTEGAGEFVEVEQHGREQHGRGHEGKIAISPEEWPTLREAIDRLIGECRSDDAGKGAA
jgi:hypothetical protein